MAPEREAWNPEPALAAAFRAAVSGADAYRAVRLALRVERGILRIGNRFVAPSRYREIAFVALGNASASLALAASEALGERLTQGYAAGPVPLPTNVPFHSVVVPSAVPGTAPGREAARAVTELAAGLTEKDLLIVLLSPGALGCLAEAPPGVEGAEWGRLLLRAAVERSPAEAVRLARIVGTGATGGRLLAATPAEVDTLVVEDGTGGALIGGGPTRCVTPEELPGAQATLTALGASKLLGTGLAPPPRRTGAPERRPVVVAGPADAIRAAGDALVDRRWITRLGTLSTALPPAGAAQLLHERCEAELRALGGRLPSTGGRGSGASEGLAVFQGSTLGALEGDSPDGVRERFLEAARASLARREAVVALFSTAGTPSGERAGLFLSPGAGGGPVRGELPMRAGITDVGPVAILLLPAPRG